MSFGEVASAYTAVFDPKAAKNLQTNGSKSPAKPKKQPEKKTDKKDAPKEDPKPKTLEEAAKKVRIKEMLPKMADKSKTTILGIWIANKYGIQMAQNILLPLWFVIQVMARITNIKSLFRSGCLNDILHDWWLK